MFSITLATFLKLWMGRDSKQTIDELLMADLLVCETIAFLGPSHCEPYFLLVAVGNTPDHTKVQSGFSVIRKRQLGMFRVRAPCHKVGKQLSARKQHFNNCLKDG